MSTSRHTPSAYHNTIKDQKWRRDDRLGHPTISKRPRMVYSKSHSRVWDFFGGQCGMEIAVLLLLVVPLTAATPLRPTHRSDAVFPGDIVQTSEVKASEDAQEQHVQALKIIPFHSEDKHLDLDALRERMAAKLRPRRAPQHGCKLGTCQIQNLANDLYHISNTNGKTTSKKARDPHGFGK